jgi:hypothetical protein
MATAGIEAPTYINTDRAFWATLKHYARLHRLDSGHLADTLRWTMHPGEPVTAEQVWRTSEALACGTYAARRSA